MSTRLQLKQWAAFRGALIALAAVVLVAAFAVTAWPRAVTGMLTDDVRFRMTQPVAGITAVQAHAGNNQGWTWELVRSNVAKTYDHLTPSLRSALERPQTSAVTTPQGTTGPKSNTSYQLQLEMFPDLQKDATLVEGTWPAPFELSFAPITLPPGEVVPPGVELPEEPVPSAESIEVAMTAESAEAMGLKLGETREMQLGMIGRQPIKLVGIVAPRDESTPYWELDYQRAHPSIANLGDAGFKATARAWINPDKTDVMQYVEADFAGWYAIKPAAYTWPNLPVIQQQLNHFLSTPRPVTIPKASAEQFIPQAPLKYATRQTELLDSVRSAGSSLQTLLILLAAAPLGAAIAVLILGSELLVERRRSILTLLSARGASSWWIRSRMALEGLVVAVPAAVVGAYLGLRATPGPVDAALVVGAASCALLPAVILAVLARPADRTARRPRRRWRWVFEILLFLATAAAIATLAERGVSPDGLDPLLVLTPLLVALSASVIVLRLYPLPLRAVHSAQRRGRGALGMVGASRSVLSIRSALIPVLVVLLGVATAVFSAVAFQTERTGVVQAAAAAAGADISVGNESLTPEQLEKMRDVAGVTDALGIRTAGFAGVTTKSGSDFIEVLVADTARLSKLQADLPDGVRIPDMSHKIGGRTPVVVGNWRGDVSGDVTLTKGTDVDVRALTSSASLGAAAPRAAWLLVDAKNLPDGFDKPTLRGALIALDGEHASEKDAKAAASAIAGIAGADSRMDVAATEAAVIRSAPAVSGVETALMIATALGALLAAVALILMLVMGARERTRLVGTLRTLGFDRGQTTGLVVWEAGPILVAGLVGGLIAGLVLPLIVLEPLDLSAFTGGSQPGILVDPASVGGIVAVFAVVVAAVLALAVWIASRRNPATVLRVGEES